MKRWGSNLSQWILLTQALCIPLDTFSIPPASKMHASDQIKLMKDRQLEQFTWWCYLIPPAWINIIIQTHKKWGVRLYIINGCIARKQLDDRSHCGYFMGYEAITGLSIYSNPDQTFLSTDTIMIDLMNIIIVSLQKTSTLPVLCLLKKNLKVFFLICT